MPKRAEKSTQPKLLSGGNPQIPKGYGNEPVQAYIDAMPGWKSAAFFRGEQLEPQPPVTSKSPGVRYLHIFEDGFDEAQFMSWVDQASALPGEKM